MYIMHCYKRDKLLRFMILGNPFSIHFSFLSSLLQDYAVTRYALLDSIIPSELSFSVRFYSNRNS